MITTLTSAHWRRSLEQTQNPEDRSCHHSHRFNEPATKVKSGMGSPDWHVSMFNIHLRRILWVYCPGHARVKGNDRADRLVGKTTVTGGLRLGRAEMLRSLRHYQGHHTIGGEGVERESAQRSSLRGHERAIVSQTSIGNVSKATLGKLTRDGVERIYRLSRADRIDTILNWTELKSLGPFSLSHRTRACCHCRFLALVWN